MYKWKPTNEKAKKRWNEILEEHKKDNDIETMIFLYKQYSGGLTNKSFNDDRKIVYMTDGMYITKDGIILNEEDAELLDF